MDGQTAKERPRRETVVSRPKPEAASAAPGVSRQRRLEASQSDMQSPRRLVDASSAVRARLPVHERCAEARCQAAHVTWIQNAV